MTRPYGIGNSSIYVDNFSQPGSIAINFNDFNNFYGAIGEINSLQLQFMVGELPIGSLLSLSSQISDLGNTYYNQDFRDDNNTNLLSANWHYRDSTR